MSQQVPDQVDQSILVDSPFNLNSDAVYETWSREKLQHKTPLVKDLLVAINDPYQLSDDEKASIASCCDKYNMAIYQLNDMSVTDKSLVHALGKQLALVNLDTNIRSDEDSVSSVEVREQIGNKYVPYTNKALSWHTDGYYNQLDKQIYGIIMHCVKSADTGGENALLNPEDVYIALRNENTAYIEALMHPEAMTIPDNVESGKVIRAAQTGPVFIVKDNGRLHMRYSARKRNIIWRDTVDTLEAVEMINQFLSDETNVFKIALKAGQGIVCNNVLHNRSSFSDSDTKKRLMYRARYYDAVMQ